MNNPITPAETDNSVITCCPDCEYGQRTVKDDSINEGWCFEDCDTCRGGGYVWKIKPLPAATLKDVA